MIETQTVRTVKNQQVGNTSVHTEQAASGVVMEKGEFTLAKLNQVFWFIGHFIATLLVLRFVFLALGANLTGIVLFIYNLTNVFVLPFRGIFPSPRAGEFFFDTAALLGIAMYYLLILLLTKILQIFSRDTTA